MTKVWCVRGEFGKLTPEFLRGGYVAIGWLPNNDLSGCTSRDDIVPLYKAEYPQDTSNVVIGQQVGQISRFLLEMKAGDTVITPDVNTEFLHHGVIQDDPSYRYVPGGDNCPYAHRRLVQWAREPILRSALSVPVQNTMLSSLTVFGIGQVEEVLQLTGRPHLAPAPEAATYDPYRAVLNRVLELDDKEFEILVGHLLTAVGFEGSEVVGKVGDGGVDAIGELNVANLAKVKVFVQAKRYKIGTRISASTVRQLRQAIPFGGQGAFITTADFQKAAFEVALEAGFPRIGLVNGGQLVDLLVEHWAEIPSDFKDLLGLKPGLVLA